jgi:phosphatidylinositol kinase/protein kinase (PI-3  family)
MFLTDTHESISQSMEKVSMRRKSYLKLYFNRLCVSPEAFHVMKIRFANSWSCLSIASYICGIGDRHNGMVPLLIQKTFLLINLAVMS